MVVEVAARKRLFEILQHTKQKHASGQNSAEALVCASSRAEFPVFCFLFSYDYTWKRPAKITAPNCNLIAFFLPSTLRNRSLHAPLSSSENLLIHLPAPSQNRLFSSSISISLSCHSRTTPYLLTATPSISP